MKEVLNILSKSTFKRLNNAAQVLTSFYISKWTKRNYFRGKPIAMSFEPTTACNLGCPECPSGLKQFTRPTGNLKKDFFESIINQVYKELMYLTFYFQGEPFINPDFLEMVEFASKKKIYTATSTNGHFITPDIAEKTVKSGLDRLIISIDGTTQKVYENYRKDGELSKVIEGTKNILAAKRKLKSKTPMVVFQFLVVRPNEHQIEEVQELAQELGVDDVWFKTAQIYDYENGNKLIPNKDKYSRYKRLQNGKYVVKNNWENNCWKMWHSTVVTWDGKIVPCCFDKDATIKLGELKQDSFNSIWYGEKYQRFRNSLLSSRNEIEICKNCSEGTKVWI